jgi:hypothetical protein
MILKQNRDYFFSQKGIMNLTIPGVMLFCGTPRSGKTNMITHVIHAIGDRVPYGFVFCPSIYDGDYSFMPKSLLYEHYEEEKIEKILNWQSKQVANKVSDNIFIVVDDLGGQVSFKSKVWQRLIRCHRHLNITLMLGIHYMIDAPPAARTICTNAFIFKQFGFQSHRRTYQEFLFGFRNERESTEFLNKCTEGKDNRYYCIVYTQMADSKKEMYQRFRAPNMKQYPFRIVIRN